LGEARNFAEAISMTAALKPDVILWIFTCPMMLKPAFVKANLSASRVLAMSLSGDYESEQEIRSIAESFVQLGRWTAKLLDQLIPAILQTEN
jgi:hypothetical protein